MRYVFDVAKDHAATAVDTEIGKRQVQILGRVIVKAENTTEARAKAVKIAGENWPRDEGNTLHLILASVSEE